MKKSKKKIDCEKLWKLEKELENNAKCPNCNDYTLVGTNPFEINLLCSKCGKIYNENLKAI